MSAFAGCLTLRSRGAFRRRTAFVGAPWRDEAFMEEAFDPVVAAEQCVGPPHPPRSDRTQREHDQRKGHRRGCIVEMAVPMIVAVSVRSVDSRARMSAVRGGLFFFGMLRRSVVPPFAMEGEEH